MSDLERLDDDLRELFAREKGSYVEDVAARDAVLRRLQAAVLLAPAAVGGAAALGAATTAGAGAGTSAVKAAGVAAVGWKVAAIGVVAFGVGLGVGEGHRALDKQERAPVAVPVATSAGVPASAPPIESAPPVTSPSSLPSARPLESAPSASPSSAPAEPAAASPVDVQAERALVDTARAALGRGLATDALAATEAHAKRFPRGRLAEEREALAVQALVANGDMEAARARASRFRRAFPDSIFRTTVERAVPAVEPR